MTTSQTPSSTRQYHYTVTLRHKNGLSHTTGTKFITLNTVAANDNDAQSQGQGWATQTNKEYRESWEFFACKRGKRAQNRKA